MNLNEYEDKHATLRVLITGLTGSGKTTLAATLAAKYRIIWIDVENALETLAKLPKEHKERIQVLKLPDSSAFPVAAQTLQALFKNLKGRICQEHGVINCPVCTKSGAAFTDLDLTTLDNKRDIVILDSLTQVGSSFLAHLMRGRPEMDKPERDDWGGLRKNTEFLSSSIQKLPFNFVATALCTEVELEDKTTKLVPTFGSRDMGANVGAKFSSVVFCKVSNRKHQAFSASTASNTFLSKSRTGYEIEKLAEPSLVPMFEGYLESPINMNNTTRAGGILNSLSKLKQ